MKNNQSIHISIKEPPNPTPIRTLGIFDDPDSPHIPQVIQSLIAGLNFESKSKEFEDNVKDEAYKLLSQYKPVAAIKQGNLIAIYVKVD